MAIWRFHEGFNVLFNKFRDFYGRCLAWALGHRVLVMLLFFTLVIASSALFPMIGIVKSNEEQKKVNHK